MPLRPVRRLAIASILGSLANPRPIKHRIKQGVYDGQLKSSRNGTRDGHYSRPWACWRACRIHESEACLMPIPSRYMAGNDEWHRLPRDSQRRNLRLNNLNALLFGREQWGDMMLLNVRGGWQWRQSSPNASHRQQSKNRSGKGHGKTFPFKVGVPMV